MIGGGGCLAAIIATMLGAAQGGWGAVLLGQPAVWTVPLAFAVMIVISLLTPGSVPANVEQAMLRMHLPEALSRSSGRDDLWAARPAARRTRGHVGRAGGA